MKFASSECAFFCSKRIELVYKTIVYNRKCARLCSTHRVQSPCSTRLLLFFFTLIIIIFSFCLVSSHQANGAHTYTRAHKNLVKEVKCLVEKKKERRRRREQNIEEKQEYYYRVSDFCFLFCVSHTNIEQASTRSIQIQTHRHKMVLTLACIEHENKLKMTINRNENCCSLFKDEIKSDIVQYLNFKRKLSKLMNSKQSNLTFGKNFLLKLFFSNALIFRKTVIFITFKVHAHSWCDRLWKIKSRRSPVFFLSVQQKVL